MPRLFTLFATLLFASACEQSDVSLAPLYSDAYTDNSEIQGRIAAVNMPAVGSFEAKDAAGYLYRTADWVDLTLQVEGPEGFTMVIVSYQDGADGAIEDPMVVGCTGPDASNLEMDEPAEEAQVTVEEVEIDGQLVERIHVEGLFDDGVITAEADLPPATDSGI